jgi:polysaccharide biosynthesis/export protein
MNRRMFINLILIPVFLIGCSNAKTIKFSDTGFGEIKKDQTGNYILGQSDVVKVTIYEKWPYSPDNSSEEMTVREDGTILVPPIGKVTVENLTVRETEEKMMKMLEAFLKKPFCQVEVKAFNSRKVCILGDMRSAVTVGIKNNERVLDILTRDGGRVDRTYLGPLKLVRKVKGTVNVYDIDLKRILQEGKLDENVLVQDGDIIFVPKHPVDELQRFLNMLTFWVPTYFVGRTLVNDVTQ